MTVDHLRRLLLAATQVCPINIGAHGFAGHLAASHLLDVGAILGGHRANAMAPITQGNRAELAASDAPGKRGGGLNIGKIFV